MDLKKIKTTKKKTTLVNLSSKQRDAGRTLSKPKTSTMDRRTKAIKKAANGCWWIETYLNGVYTWKAKSHMNGVDDE